MIIQVNNDAELKELKKHVKNVPTEKTPCLIQIRGDEAIHVTRFDSGALGLLSVSVAIERIKDEMLYNEINKLPRNKIDALIERLGGTV